MTTKDLLLSAWNFNWAVPAACVALVAYAAAFRFKSLGRMALFTLGVAVFTLSLISPINTLADGYLFTAHMLQHMLLLMIVPVLLLLGMPPVSDASKGWGRFHLSPGLTWLGGVGAMWLWHLPTLCNAAVASGPVKAFQVASLVGMGLLFWLPIIGPNTEKRLSPWLGMFYLFSACASCILLGILIFFDPVTLCSIFSRPAQDPAMLSVVRDSWGFSPRLDQQVGGLMMWVPSCLVYLGGILGLLMRWYGESTNGMAGSPLSHPISKAGENHV